MDLGLDDALCLDVVGVGADSHATGSLLLPCLMLLLLEGFPVQFARRKPAEVPEPLLVALGDVAVEAVGLEACAPDRCHRGEGVVASTVGTPADELFLERRGLNPGQRRGADAKFPEQRLLLHARRRDVPEPPHEVVDLGSGGHRLAARRRLDAVEGELGAQGPGVLAGGDAIPGRARDPQQASAGEGDEAAGGGHDVELARPVEEPLEEAPGLRRLGLLTWRHREVVVNPDLAIAPLAIEDQGGGDHRGLSERAGGEAPAGQGERLAVCGSRSA